MPQRLEKTIKVINIIMFSFRFLFCLNKTNKPRPEPDRSPEIQLPNGNTSCKYNSVITTLDAQFGISPTKLDKIGLIILLLYTKVFNVSLSIREFKITLTIKINKVIFIVWIILDLRILSSQ